MLAPQLQLHEDMELEMSRFATNQDFVVFKHHSSLLKAACESIESELAA